MTPDLKRLCNEAWRATQSAFADGKMPHEVNEAIVRAVLMALREPSEAMQRAGGQAIGYVPSLVPAEIFPAMIDAILAEPAKA